VKQVLKAASVVVLAVLIASCGGGSGSSASTPPIAVTPPPPPPPPPPTSFVRVDSTGVDVGFLNQPYNFQIAATAEGVNFVQTSVAGSLPPGIAFSTNVLSGTPTQTGVFVFTYTISNRDQPTMTASRQFTLQILPSGGMVRNDSIAAATQLVCCVNIKASLSPYSKASGVVAPDQDYYRMTANAGDRISVTTTAIGTAIDTDTVIEILDVNGTRMTTCKTPQASAAFNQSCLNDDINPGIVRGSHLDVQLPASSGVFIVHVIDWEGRARPEMTYELDTAKLQ
jgi:hypothetical protein